MKQQQKQQTKGRRPGLQTIRPQVAGIDLGSREHWVCGPSREDGEPNVRTFGTTTGQLRELADCHSCHSPNSPKLRRYSRPGW